MSRRLSSHLLTALLALGAQAAAAIQEERRVDSPPGLAAWEFLLGEWRIEQRRYSFDSELIEQSTGSATFDRVMDGQRIQEHQRIVHAGQVTDALHTFVYDPRSEEVEIARTDSGHFGFQVIVGTLSPERLELREKHPRPGSDVTRRISYVRLGDDRFRRTLEFSVDAGESWFVRSEQIYTRAE